MNRLRFGRSRLRGKLASRLFCLALLSVLCWQSGHSALAASETLDSLVNRGNAAAEKQEYALAIQCYETATQKAPADRTLKNNLAILYANYAVEFQEKQQYDTALKYFDQAMAVVTPGSHQAKNIQDSKASLYFAQAMTQKEAMQSPTATDYANVRALLDKAMALSPQEPAFKRAMAGVYLDEAYQLALESRYHDAQPLLEKALTYDPQNQPTRQSLANVYLGLARTEPEHREEWLEKALATDTSPKIQQVAEQLRKSPQALQGSVATGGFAALPKEAQAAMPAGLAQLSVADMLHDMEMQLQITPPAKATLNDRLDGVEKQVWGKTQNGALATRAKNVYTALMGSYDGMVGASNPQLTQAPVLSSDATYLDEIFKVTDGKVIRWGKFPLRIYFEEPKDNALFRPEYKAAALEGFNAWKSQTNGFVQYVEIKNPAAADIEVSWTDQYVDRFADPEHVPTVYQHYSPPKGGKLLMAVQMASMFTPGYFSLAPRAAAAAMQYQQYKKLDVIREESKIKLGLQPTQGLNPEAAQRIMQNMAAKELGHALGLKGNSSQQGDLLYPELRSDQVQLPSSRDLATLREIYNRPPNIILNTR